MPFLVYNSYQQNYYNVILSYLSKNYGRFYKLALRYMMSIVP